MKEMFAYKNQKKLRWGYTTGTCAAAASLAAALMLLGKKRIVQVRLTVPKGIELELEIEDIQAGNGWVSCAVRKDGGNDPDATHGLLVYSTVGYAKMEKERMEPECGYTYEGDGLYLKLTAADGVGMVTKPGLSCPAGKPAINPVPRSMIFGEVEKACQKYGFHGTLGICISVPQGKETAKRTFNPRMGILGGISILGTSGMVEPMSEKALLETIRLEMHQKHLAGNRRLILTPGNYGEAFLRSQLNIDLEQAVKCSNFIGDTLDMAAQEGMKELLLVGHGGKLVKLAAGVMNTHSSAADGRMEVLAAWGAALGASREQVIKILEAVTVDQGLLILEQQTGLREAVMEQVMKRAWEHLKKRAGEKLKIECIMFTNERGILGETPGARVCLERFQNSAENR